VIKKYIQSKILKIKSLVLSYPKYFIIGAISFCLLISFIFCLPRPLFDVSYSPVLYDKDNHLLGAQVSADGQWRFPGTDLLNEKFVTAIIEAEDKRFRRHIGVDFLAIGRAAIQNIRNRKTVSGGSTITMQTIRLARGLRKRNIFTKAIEAVMAVRLEIGKSKNDILELYAANAPFGANVVGLEAASWRWFGRSSGDLSWAEAATLAVLPNSPALIHPGRNRDTLKNKRDSLLIKLNNKGYIDNETLQLSFLESLPGEPFPLPRLAPHLLDRLVLQTGGIRAFKQQAAFVTTIDRDIQERAAAILNRAGNRFMTNGIMNGACLIINTQTGEAAAYIGNITTPSASDVDIISSRRSSGSLLKPFLYAAMLDSGDILPASLVSDIPTRVGSFSPENISRTYLGVAPADEALARSLNVPAARSLRVYGVDRFARFLRSLGLTTLFRSGDDYGLPLILGGAEVTLWEITALYAGLGRSVHAREDDGKAAFFPPSVFHRNKIPSKPASKMTAISPAAAWLTLEALVWATRPGEEAVWQEYASSRRIAWKTGTSFGFRDAWAIGVTPEWTVGVWIGNATGEGRAELRSAVTAAPVLFEIFSALSSLGGHRTGWFSQPAIDIRYAEVCAQSGYPAGVNCEFIKAAQRPRNAPAVKACAYCRIIVLNEKQDRQITLEAGASLNTVERKWFVLPPAEEWYYRRWNLDYRPLPPEEGSSSVPGERVIALFNPEPRGQIYIPRELDGREGKIVFSAAHRDDTGIIYWHLDGEYLGETHTFHEMEARPPPGQRRITLVDTQGNTISREFTVLNQN
jgi:penicillin-binding protein 1C